MKIGVWVQFEDAQNILNQKKVWRYKCKFPNFIPSDQKWLWCFSHHWASVRVSPTPPPLLSSSPSSRCSSSSWWPSSTDSPPSCLAMRSYLQVTNKSEKNGVKNQKLQDLVEKACWLFSWPPWWMWRLRPVRRLRERPLTNGSRVLSPSCLYYWWQNDKCVS